MSLRQAGRMLGMDCHSVQHKLRKIARHLRLLDRSLTCSVPADRTIGLDEMEAFEHRSIQPVTAPMLEVGAGTCRCFDPAIPARRTIWRQGRFR